MNSIKHFASQHRLRVRRDECGDPIVVGKLGQLYQHDDGLVGLVLMSPNGDDPKLDNTLRARRRKALQEGSVLVQQGDYESSFLFDAENKQHARLAVRLIRCKRKRRAKLSPNFLAARERFKFKPRTVQEGPERPQSEPIPVLAGV